MSPTPIERFARWLATRDDRLHVCGYGNEGRAFDGTPCTVMVTDRATAAAGHRGYCSPEHEYAAVSEALL